MKNRRTQGFTLIELLIVIAIIGILAAVLIPNLLNARRSANNSAASSYLRNAVTAAEAYRSNYNTTLGTADVACTDAKILGGDTPSSVKASTCVIKQGENSTTGFVESTAGGKFVFDGAAIKRDDAASAAPTPQ